MKGPDHVPVGLTEGNEPRADFRLRSRGCYEVEAVREFLEDDDGAREQATLAVDLGAHVLTDGGPPDVASKRGAVL